MTKFKKTSPDSGAMYIRLFPGSVEVDKQQQTAIAAAVAAATSGGASDRPSISSNRPEASSTPIQTTIVVPGQPGGQQKPTFFTPAPHVTFGSLHIAKREINSLNFDYPFASKALVEEEKKCKPQQEIRFYYIQWLVVILLGIVIPLTFVVHQVAIGEVLTLKSSLTADLLNRSLPLAFVFWCMTNTALAVMSGFLVVFVEELGEGSGFAEVMGFLNGVDIVNFSSPIAYLIRHISTFLMVCANMPGGLEEPFLPTGPMLGSASHKIGMSDAKPFLKFQWDEDKKHFAAAGLAASSSAVFGTPLGGSLFALEHISHWRGKVLFLFIVSSTISSFIATTLYTYYRELKDGHQVPVDIFSTHRAHDIKFNFDELPLFLLIGILGAIGGAFWNFIQIIIIHIRRRVIRGNLLRMLEIVVISFLISASGLGIYLATQDDCTSEKLRENAKSEVVEKFVGQCENGTYATMSILIFQEPRYIIRSLFTFKSNEMSLNSLSIFLILYFFWTVIHAGTYMPSGVLFPNIIIGALWGRLLSGLLSTSAFSFVKNSYKSVNKLAYLSAVAQASGSTRLSLGLSIIMVEASGSINFLIPVAIIVISTRWLSGMMNSSIIKIMAYYKGYILLGSSPIPLCVNLSVADIMCPYVVCLPNSLTVEALLKVLETHKHLEFPIVNGGGVATPEKPIAAVKGIILRKQLLALLKYKPGVTKLSIIPNQEKFSSSLPFNKELDLEEIMNPAPFYINKAASMSRAYSLFVGLALHSLLVMDESMQLIGIVTRKDLALIRKDFNLWRIRLVTDSVAFQ